MEADHQTRESMEKPPCTVALMGFPGGASGKESTCNAAEPGFIPGLGRPPGEGNGDPVQDSCLENPMDRGALRATVCRVETSN